MTANPNPILRDVAPLEARSPEIGHLLGMLEAGTRNMRSGLGEIDEDALVWQPCENAHSIGALLIHVAACEAAWLHLVAAGQDTPLDLEEQMMGGPSIDQYAGIWPAPPRRPLSWYYAQHDETRARTLALVPELPDAEEVREVVWGPGRICTVRWILHHVIEHEAYHLGQAVLLSLLKEQIGRTA